MRKWFAVAVLVFAITLAYIYVPDALAKTDSGYVVKRVIDGDTFVIKKGREDIKIRLIGVDTPESVHTDKTKNTVWGKKASKYTKSRLVGTTVYIETDIQSLDAYGRTLAYVYTDKAKTKMFNKELVQRGYARAVCYEPNSLYKKEFASLQKKARQAKKGFWKTGYKSAFPN